MNNDRDILKGAVAGLVAGIVASWVMNEFQACWSHLFENKEKAHGAQSQQTGSPEHGAGAFLRELGADEPDDNAAERAANYLAVKTRNEPLSKREKDIGGRLFHYAFGGTTAACYGAASEVIPTVRTGLGLPFGVAVWALADEVTVPALGLSRPATDYPLSIHAYALASHLVYGLTTEITLRAVRQVM